MRRGSPFPPGRSRAGRPCRRGRRSHRCTMPSPPQTKMNSAPFFSAALDALGREPALRHLRPDRIDRHPRGRASRGAPRALRRSSCRHGRSLQPSSCPLDDSRRWMPPPSRRSAAAPAARAAKTVTHERADAQEQAGGAVRQMVHAAVHARPGDEERDRDQERPQSRDGDDGATDPRGEHQQQPPVQGKCRGRVTGRVARVDGRLSSRSTWGRSRWTKRVVARYAPDSMQITNRTKAARRQRRKARNTTRQQAHHRRDHEPPASVEPIHDRCSRLGSRWSASQRLMRSSQAANPPIGNSDRVNTRPTATVRARRLAYPVAIAARKTTTGRCPPMCRENASAKRSGLCLEQRHVRGWAPRRGAGPLHARSSRLARPRVERCRATGLLDRCHAAVYPLPIVDNPHGGPRASRREASVSRRCRF